MSDENPNPQPRSGEPVTSENVGNTPTADAGQSPRYKAKSPGRVAWMKRLHEEGRAFASGGPRPKHGIRALEDRLRRGLDPETPLAIIHADFKARYLADLGGAESVSAMEEGVCDRLADLDLVRGLLNAQRDGMKRLSLAQIEAYATTVSRNAAAYLQAVKTVGPGRRQKETDKMVVVRRYAETTPAETSPGNGQEQRHPEAITTAGAQQEHNG